METPPTPLQPQPPAARADSAAAGPPWAPKRAKPRAVTARAQQPEALHWGVVALTAFTALSVVVGSYGGHAAQPKELLPIVIEAP